MADDPIELFEGLRPDDDPLTDAGREAIWARLVEPPRAGESTGELEVGGGPVDIGRRRRVIAIAIAAALVLAVLMVATNRSSEFAERGRSGSGPDVSATTAETVAPVVASTALAATSAPQPVYGSIALGSPDDVPWYLPSWLPDGVAVWVAHSQRMIDSYSIVSSGRWIERGPDGRTVKAIVSALISPLAPGTDLGSTTATVHGVPAYVVTGGPDSKAVTVGWIERDHQWSLEGLGIGEDDLVRLADASSVQIDPAVLTFSAKSGFEAVTVPDGPFNTMDGSSLTAGRYEDGQLGQWVDVRVEGTRGGETLDGTVSLETRRVTLDGIERSITDRPPEDPRVAHIAVWYAGGYRVTVRVRQKLDRSSLDKLLAGVRRATADDVKAVQEELSRRGVAAPMVDSAVESDGTVLSVRGERGDVRYACASSEGVARCVVGSPVSLIEGLSADSVVVTRVLLGQRVVAIGWRTGGTNPSPTAPGQETLRDVAGGVGVFSYATKPAGRVDQFFPTPSGDAWDEFWAELPAVPDTSASTAIAASKDPQLVTLPWLLDAMADRTGRVAAVLAPRVDGPPRELRPARRSPKLPIDDVAAALEAQVRSLLTPGVSVTIYLAEFATAGDPAGEAAAAQLIYDVEISGVGCAPSTATTAPPGATTAPVPCVIHLRVDADTGALLERWEQFSVG